jgi:methionyl-tRNA formyltransferase
VVARIAAAEPELLVSWFWTKRVPARVRALAPLGAIGVHPSLLPRHRGPDPFFWAIDQGDRAGGERDRVQPPQPRPAHDHDQERIAPVTAR